MVFLISHLLELSLPDSIFNFWVGFYLWKIGGFVTLVQ